MGCVPPLPSGGCFTAQATNSFHFCLKRFTFALGTALSHSLNSSACFGAQPGASPESRICSSSPFRQAGDAEHFVSYLENQISPRCGLHSPLSLPRSEHDWFPALQTGCPSGMLLQAPSSPSIRTSLWELPFPFLASPGCLLPFHGGPHPACLPTPFLPLPLVSVLTFPAARLLLSLFSATFYTFLSPTLAAVRSVAWLGTIRVFVCSSGTYFLPSPRSPCWLLG